jgi:hypothetical protein
MDLKAVLDRINVLNLKEEDKSAIAIVAALNIFHLCSKKSKKAMIRYIKNSAFMYVLALEGVKEAEGFVATCAGKAVIGLISGNLPCVLSNTANALGKEATSDVVDASDTAKEFFTGCMEFIEENWG